MTIYHSQGTQLIPVQSPNGKSYLVLYIHKTGLGFLPSRENDKRDPLNINIAPNPHVPIYLVQSHVSGIRTGGLSEYARAYKEHQSSYRPIYTIKRCFRYLRLKLPI